MNVQYQEVYLKDVISYYVDGFENSEKISSWEI